MRDDLKDYEAPTFWRMHRDKVWGAAFVALWLFAMATPDQRPEPITVNSFVRAPDPWRLQEHPSDLMRLSLPVQCVRPEGVEGVGREWIRQWGDGQLPPLVPNCVKASR